MATPMKRIEVGPLSVLLDGPDLRYLELNGNELLRRVTVAVRDEAWGTLEPDTVEIEVVPISPEAVEIVAECAHRSEAAEVTWRTTARLTAGGELSYTAEMQPLSPFRYNRMGICLLHPPAALVGSSFEAETPAGPVSGGFEAEIGPQRIEGDEIFPLFPAFSRLRIEGDGGVVLDFRFEGDLFEMEDQRNWSDGSFKTYCTPLSLPRPHAAEPGKPVLQRVELALGGTLPAAAPVVGDGVVAIEIGGEPAGSRVPGLGLYLAGPAPSPPAAGSLPAGLEHVRVDLRPTLDPAAVLAAGAAAATAAGAGLVVALHLHDAAELEALEEPLSLHADLVRRLLVFEQGAEASPGPLVAAARERLGAALPAARFAGGTDLWFTQINRVRPETAAMDAVAWSVTPQVHGFDALTVMESLAAQADQVASAGAIAPGLDVLVGPVTLRPRYNPAAADWAQQALEPPPESIDPRQDTLFAAAFTAGSLAQLAAAGADFVTSYEADGPRGVLGENGEVLPCWHPIADVAGWAGWSVLPVGSPRPLAVQALAVRDPDGGGTGIVVANLRDERTPVRLAGVPAGEAVIRVLDAATRAVACSDAAGFRSALRPAAVVDGSLALDLDAHAVATILVPGPA